MMPKVNYYYCFCFAVVRIKCLSCSNNIPTFTKTQTQFFQTGISLSCVLCPENPQFALLFMKQRLHTTVLGKS